jgi:hypothetical protein
MAKLFFFCSLLLGMALCLLATASAWFLEDGKVTGRRTARQGLEADGNEDDQGVPLGAKKDRQTLVGRLVDVGRWSRVSYRVAARSSLLVESLAGMLPRFGESWTTSAQV